MSYNPQKVIGWALGEVGYHEKASNSQLDDPKANPGDGNWNKYAAYLDSLPDSASAMVVKPRSSYCASRTTAQERSVRSRRSISTQRASSTRKTRNPATKSFRLVLVQRVAHGAGGGGRQRHLQRRRAVSHGNACTVRRQSLPRYSAS